MPEHSTRAVAYYRMSTDQQEASIPQQREWAVRAAKREGLELAAEFEDEGVPGGEIARRPGLAQLLAWCAGHGAGAVVVWDADRLSRADSIQTAAVLNTLIQSGATRLLTHEGWIDLEDDVDRLLFHIRQDMSRAAYSKSLSRNVTRSAVARARQGLWVAGRPPYAYRIGEDGHLALGDPGMVETVRWIFRHFAGTSDSCGDVCRKLIARGAPPPPARLRKGQPWGGRWQRGVINDILNCRAYLGELVWNASTRGKYSRVAGGEVAPVKGRGRRRFARNAAEDCIVVRDAHPAVIDRETFEACQRKLLATRRGQPRCRTTPKAGGGDWVLSGLLHCGMCGGRMVGITERRVYAGKEHVYRRYVCVAGQRSGPGSCRKNAVRQEDIIREVARLIQDSFTDPGRLALLRAEVEAQAGRDEGERRAERERLQAAAAQLARQVEQGNRNLALLPPDRIPGVVAQVRAWEAEREALARELARLDAAAEVQADYARHAAEALAQLRDLQEVIRAAAPEDVRNALGGLIEKISLFFEYGPPDKGGYRPTTLTEFEVTMRPEAAGLLGPPSELRRSARSTV
jgi:site-specific DNA recombinase